MSKDRSASSSKNRNEAKTPAKNGKSSALPTPEQESFLAGYPGAALLIGADGVVIASNAKAAGLEALIEHEAAPEINDLIEAAKTSHAVAAGSVSLTSAKGDIVLEITVVPNLGQEGELVLMARDMTMERNLRTALVESRQRYKDLVEVSSDFSWETNDEGEFIFVSPKGALGYKAEELINSKARDLVISPEQFSPLPFVSKRSLDKVEIWMTRKDGNSACVILSCVPLVAEQQEGEAQWMGSRGVCRNVTDERENESALARARRREQHLNYIVNSIREELEPHNMLDAAASAMSRALGTAGCRIYRRDKKGAFQVAAEHGNAEGLKDLDGKLNSLINGDQVIDETAGKWRVLASATKYRQGVNGAIAIWKAAGEEAWDDDHQLLIGDVANQLGIANEQISNHERIVALSRTDSMTGLLNRRAFYEEDLPRRIARLERTRQTAALFYADLDNFKLVNDVHGHQAGDDALMFLRDMLMEMSRPGDVIARLGGDEFAMWMDGISPEVTEKRAARLMEASKALEKFSGHKDHPLGLSVGIAMFDPETKESLDTLIARADAAMYEVKNAGKGGFRMALPPEQSGVSTSDKKTPEDSPGKKST
ncbi:MAG: diguanylate cyclase [Proteobacteria bacterium]|nr:diguanylate cyclase [Pseudomonadota bacterium]